MQDSAPFAKHMHEHEHPNDKVNRKVAAFTFSEHNRSTFVNYQIMHADM
jgi:hypothetical protein